MHGRQYHGMTSKNVEETLLICIILKSDILIITKINKMRKTF